MLLLLPAILSLAPPRRIPTPLRYENAYGDVVEIGRWRKRDPAIFLKLQQKRTGCAQVLEGRADKRPGNRYCLKTSETEIVLRVSERKVRIVRISLSPVDDKACSSFEGVYRRKKTE